MPLLTPARKDVDFLNPNQIQKYLNLHSPNFIINSVAYTNVDKAENNTDYAFRINAYALKFICNYCKQRDVPLIHLSTDYVFNGESRTPYKETDIPNPINVYGKSKLEGESIIQDKLRKFIILRTSWVFGSRRINFFKSVTKQIKNERVVKVFANEVSCPTWCRDIAKCIFDLYSQLFENYNHKKDYGIFHYCGSNGVNRFSYASKIIQGLHLDIKPKVIRLKSENFMERAPRPEYSILDTSKIQSVFNIKIPFWEDSLIKAINELDVTYK